jgi:putative endonuclease
MADQLNWLERPDDMSGRSSVRLRYSPQNKGSLNRVFFNAFLVCIIYSHSLDQYYVDQSENLDDRIFRHDNSGNKSTKKANDWQLVHSEKVITRMEAVRRETEIKKKKSRKYIEWLTNSTG